MGHDSDVKHITVLVADAQLLIADALAVCLRLRKGIKVLDEYPHHGIYAIEAVTRLRPDVAVLDYWLEDMDGPVVTRSIVQAWPGARIINLSWFHGPEHIQAALAAGAVGFLPKAVRVEKVAEAIRRAHAGDRPVFREALEEMVGRIDERAAFLQKRAAGAKRLTRRQLEVVRLLGDGRPLDEVARELGIKLSTARNHVHRILAKTGARTQLEAVAFAREAGLIP